MTNKVGFAYEDMPQKTTKMQNSQQEKSYTPRKSVVLVYFSDDSRELSYYNDQFDLHKGDLVFVDGALAGVQGRVVEVTYNFKIKLSQYKRVIAVADTDVHGELFMAGSYYITFDPAVLPAEKITSWYFPPVKEEDTYASGNDDTFFYLEDLKGMHVSEAIMERGVQYYSSRKVKYLSLNGTRGYAVVEGTQPYEVEFEYENGEIRNLTCTCFCSYPCKHQVAVMLQLKEMLETIHKRYEVPFEKTSYFAAVTPSELMYYVLAGRETGSITI